MSKTDFKIIYDQAKEMYLDGADIEEIIFFLKKEGASQGQTAFSLKEMGVGSSAHCKKLVISSESWVDRRDINCDIQKLIDDFDPES